MKKLLLIIPIIALLAAGCNASQQATVQAPLANQTTPNTQTQIQQNASQSDYSPSQTNAFKTFSSKYFNISFEYPEGYDVHDTQDEIDIAKGTYEESEIGRDNSFLRIRRFNSDFTYAKQNKADEDESKTYITVDGTKFTAYTSTDTNSCEGSALGKYARIIFPKSELSMQQYECGESGPDYTSVEQHILSTLKFTK